MSIQQAPLKAVLLTGAGFSKPFGGYLAAEMWAAILRQQHHCFVIIGRPQNP